jgi:hypothetical protein
LLQGRKPGGASDGERGVPRAAEEQLSVVVLVAVGVSAVDPGEVLVDAGAEKCGSVAGFFGPIGGDGAPKLG